MSSTTMEKVVNRNALEAKKKNIKKKKEWNEETSFPLKAKELKLAVPTRQQSSQGKSKLPVIFPNLAQKYCDLRQWLFHNLQPQGQTEAFKKGLHKHATHLNSKKSLSVTALSHLKKSIVPTIF